MAEEQPTCAACAARKIKKLTLLDGFHVGIANLDDILKEVADLKLIDDEAIKKELLTRVKIYNYVAPAGDYYYSQALLSEYGRKFGNSK